MSTEKYSQNTREKSASGKDDVMTSFTRKVVQDPDNPDELLLDLGDEICDLLGWHEGDRIEWIDNKDGTWTLKKTE